MIVRNVTLNGFRNYDIAQAEFCDGINVITGQNANGKTNLLEAVYCLTCGRSFRTRSDKELINFDRTEASVIAEVSSFGRDQKLELCLSKNKRRKIIANGVKLKTAAELSGRLTAVLFCPEDLYMIRAGASVRRKLMDDCLCQLVPRYAKVLSDFMRAYEQKTRILKDWRDKPSLLDTLDDYNIFLAEKNAEIIHYRARLSLALKEKAVAVHREFSGETENLDIEYKTVSNIDDPFKKPSELLYLLMEHQKTHRQAELDSGLCLSGSHKDDLIISINGNPARSFASQGQARTAALSIKLAEREIHKDSLGEYPVLLLDDVLSELDAVRQNFVLNRIKDGQVLITCCEGDDITEKTGGRVLKIENGRVMQ